MVVPTSPCSEPACCRMLRSPASSLKGHPSARNLRENLNLDPLASESWPHQEAVWSAERGGAEDRRAKVELVEEIRREYEFGTGPAGSKAKKLGVHPRVVSHGILAAMPP